MTRAMKCGGNNHDTTRTARMGKFFSDRAIRKYCEKIWKTTAIFNLNTGLEAANTDRRHS